MKTLVLKLIKKETELLTTRNLLAISERVAKRIIDGSLKDTELVFENEGISGELSRIFFQSLEEKLKEHTPTFGIPIEVKVLSGFACDLIKKYDPKEIAKQNTGKLYNDTQTPIKPDSDGSGGGAGDASADGSSVEILSQLPKPAAAP